MGHREWLQETSESLVGRIVPVAEWTGVNEFRGVLHPSSPPEPLLQVISSTLAPRMAIELGAMASRAALTLSSPSG